MPFSPDPFVVPHLCFPQSTCRDAFLFEDCVEDSPLRHELTHEKVQAVNGRITVPDGPGLGVTINEDFVQDHLISESR